MDSRSYTFTRDDCRLCHSKNLEKRIPLAPLPISSPNVGRQLDGSMTAAADVYHCRDCGFLQLNTIVDPEFQYRGFKYFTGLSKGLKEHFFGLIDALARSGGCGPGSLILDIGSNDGSVLAMAKAKGASVIGVDPAVGLAKAANEAGIPTFADFFTVQTARAITHHHGRADVALCFNTLANVDDLDAVMAAVDAVLAKDGVLIVETQYAVDLLARRLLDVIYHEHLSYFSLSPMMAFARRHGFEVFDAERIAPKGGSIRFWVQRAVGRRPASARLADLLAEEEAPDGILDGRVVDAFAAAVAEIGNQTRARLEASRREHGRAIVYGSSVGCSALIHFFGLETLIDVVYDDMPLQGAIQTAKGTIPILLGEKLAEDVAGDVGILAWRYANTIVEKHAPYIERGGRFFRVLPSVETVF